MLPGSLSSRRVISTVIPFLSFRLRFCMVCGSSYIMKQRRHGQRGRVCTLFDNAIALVGCVRIAVISIGRRAGTGTTTCLTLPLSWRNTTINLLHPCAVALLSASLWGYKKLQQIIFVMPSRENHVVFHNRNHE
jgi:hypothetical protein